jgi:hemerythrin-like domain-containing protein
MSQLIENLVAEHDRILAVIGALDDFAVFHAAEEPQVRTALADFVRFLREYADGWHHGKEENLLFDAMVQLGFPRDAGPIGCMLREHVEGRRYIAGMAALAQGVGPLSAAELAELGELSTGYADVLVPHIEKENQVLYPMAARVIPRELLDALDQAAAAFAARRGATLGRDLERLGQQLVDRYRAARLAAAR